MSPRMLLNSIPGTEKPLLAGWRRSGRIRLVPLRLPTQIRQTGSSPEDGFSNSIADSLTGVAYGSGAPHQPGQTGTGLDRNRQQRKQNSSPSIRALDDGQLERRLTKAASWKPFRGLRSTSRHQMLCNLA